MRTTRPHLASLLLALAGSVTAATLFASAAHADATVTATLSAGQNGASATLWNANSSSRSCRLWFQRTDNYYYQTPYENIPANGARGLTVTGLPAGGYKVGIDCSGIAQGLPQQVTVTGASTTSGPNTVASQGATGGGGTPGGGTPAGNSLGSL